MKDDSQHAGRSSSLALPNGPERLSQTLDIPQSAVLVPVSDDASFRRYFRFSEGGAGLVFVDAPPEQRGQPKFR